MDKVYVETTIPSYLTAHPSQDGLVNGHQRLTKEWWKSRSCDFELYVSELVLAEAAKGDPEAAARRLSILAGIPVLPISVRVLEVASVYSARIAILRNATEDAIHLAVASVNELDFLVTWNCRHIARAEVWPELWRINDTLGLRTPFICTPEELLGGD